MLVFVGSGSKIGDMRTVGMSVREHGFGTLRQGCDPGPTPLFTRPPNLLSGALRDMQMLTLTRRRTRRSKFLSAKNLELWLFVEKHWDFDENA